MAIDKCVERHYDVTARTMPDQFFFVQVDGSFADGYNPKGSGLIESHLVIRDNTIRAVQQEKGAECHHRHKWITDCCENEGAFGFDGDDDTYMACMFGEDVLPNTNTAVITTENMEYQSALFEHTINSGQNVQVYPANLCRGTVNAVKAVLRAEVYFLNPQVVGSGDEIYDDDSDDNQDQETQYSVFEPIVIAGKSLQEALASVADTYDVTDYAARTHPTDKDGAPWMEDFRFAFYTTHGEDMLLTFTDEEVARFQERYDQLPRPTPPPAPTHSAEWNEVVEKLIDFYFWLHCDNYTRKHMSECLREKYIKLDVKNLVFLLDDTDQDIRFECAMYCHDSTPGTMMEKVHATRIYKKKRFI